MREVSCSAYSGIGLALLIVVSYEEGAERSRSAELTISSSASAGEGQVSVKGAEQAGNWVLIRGCVMSMWRMN